MGQRGMGERENKPRVLCVCCTVLVNFSFMQWLWQSGYSPSTYRGRLSAVIFLQRHSFRDIGSLRNVWKGLVAYESKHIKKTKIWLTREQLICFLEHVKLTSIEIVVPPDFLGFVHCGGRVAPEKKKWSAEKNGK